MGKGPKAFAQISHAGAAADSQMTGCPVLGPSAASDSAGDPVFKNMNLKTKAMDSGDIKKVIRDFVSAALRAKAAGFDGVEIHSAHRYLLNQLYSPLTNKRTDEYSGNTLEGRLRLHLEIIQAIREAVGKDYPLAIRLGACDYMDGGTTLEDSIRAAKYLEAVGIDLLDISGGLCGTARPGHPEPGYFSELSQGIKENVSIPVMVTGGVRTPEDAKKLLADGKADLIGVGRALLKDPDWAAFLRCRLILSFK